MSDKQRFLMGLSVAIAVVGLGLVASTALAQTPSNAGFVGKPLNPAAGPPISAGTDVLDKAEYEQASEFTKLVTPYIHLDEQGVPRLDEGVTAAQLGVSEKFLADFELALDFASKAIVSGDIVVNDDLTVETTGAVRPADGSFVPAGAPAGSSLDASTEPGTVDWQGWRYNNGAMFYNAYEDYWSYYYNRYYVLCSSMAAHLGYPWMSSNLVYFYGYNGWYFNQYCNRGYGMYWFMPYSTSGCQQYYPCYCCGSMYRVVYIWVVSYQYYPSCGCQQPTWGWQGYWARY